MNNPIQKSKIKFLFITKNFEKCAEIKSPPIISILNYFHYQISRETRDFRMLCSIRSRRSFFVTAIFLFIFYYFVSFLFCYWNESLDFFLYRMNFFRTRQVWKLKLITCRVFENDDKNNFPLNLSALIMISGSLNKISTQKWLKLTKT